jgi:hypothetical protein
MKIIFIFDQPITNWIFDKYFADIVSKLNIEVEIYNFENTNENFSLTTKKIFSNNNLSYYKINTINQFKNYLKKNTTINFYYINELSPLNNCLEIEQEFYNYKCCEVILNGGSLPDPNYDNQYFKFFVKKIIKRFYYTLYNKFIRFNHNKLYVVSGNKIYNLFLNRGIPIKQIIKAHNFDYDIYLESKRSKISVNYKNYFLFLDENICEHRDYEILKINPPVTEINYFNSLIIYLKKIELSHNLIAVIALHPRTYNSDILNKYYNNFKVEIGNTSNLVKNARFILCHNSTSIQFAVLFKKEIYFLVTDEIVNSYFYRYIKIFANELNRNISNIDKSENIILSDINNKIYDRYISNYIKNNKSPNIKFWDIVLNHLTIL